RREHIYVDSVAFAPDGHTLVCTLEDWHLPGLYRTDVALLLSAATGAVRGRLAPPCQEISGLAAAAGGPLLAAGHAGGRVSLWDLRSGSLSSMINTGPRYPGEVGLSSDGRTLS